MTGKFGLLIGFGAGYVLGARAGRQRYDQIVAKVQKFWRDPRVQEKAGQATDIAKEKAGHATEVAKEKATHATEVAKEKAGHATGVVKEKVSHESSGSGRNESSATSPGVSPGTSAG